MTTDITWYIYGDMPKATETAILDALAEYESVLDVRFVRQPASGLISFTESDIWGSSAATVGLPSTVWLYPGEGKLWPLHELGHSFGMEDRPSAPVSRTIMGEVYDIPLIPQGLMADDVAALVPIWGASHENDGDTLWVPNPLVLDSIIDFDGTDTLDLRRSNGADVDLGAGWVHHGQGGATWIMDGSIEAVKLSPGVDRVWLSPGELIQGLGREDVLFADDGEAHRLAKREVRDLGMRGKVFEIDDALVAWKGSERALEKLVVEGEA